MELGQSDYLLLAKLLKLPLSAYECIAKEDYVPLERILDALSKHRRTELLDHLASVRKECEGVQLVSYGSSSYPSSFLQLSNPPGLLFVVGDIDCLQKQALSIVGSREPDRRVLEWMGLHIFDFLSHRKSFTIISGGARGVDTEAMRIAISAGSSVITYVPSGLKRPYPRGLASYMGGDSCVFVSEYLPNTEMRKFHFYQRNRLIAAHGQALFAVQSHIKSGTMITVRAALELGRDVWTLPDFPNQRQSSGNLELLVSGATMICDSRDMQIAMAGVGPSLC